MSTRLGLGIVGAGRMGSTHARTIAGSVPEVKIVGIADVNLELARNLSAELGIEAAYPSATELIADRRVDAILVAASSDRHLAVIREAATTRTDVLCEKPLALTLEDSREAMAVAERAGIRLQVGFMRRWDADYRRARARIAGGELGRTVLFKSLQFDTELPPPSFRDPRVSGGIMVDMGIHEFDLARWLMDDEVVQVHAYGSSVLHPDLGALGDVENAVIDLRLARGGVGSVELSRTAVYGEDVRTEVMGELGSVFVGFLPAALGAVGQPGRLAYDTVPSSMTRFATAFAEQVRGFARAIREDRPVEVGGADSTAALAIALAARQSLEEDRTVEVAAG